MNHTRTPENPDALGRAREKALRLLAVRSRSTCELRQRLLQGGHREEVVETLLDRLTETGLLDDRAFAEERARAMGSGRGWGPRKLRADLLRRGIPEEVVSQAVQQAYGTKSCGERMREVALKRFGDELFSGERDPRRRSQAQRFLLSRGFDPEAVFALLGPVTNTPLRWL